jgi:hypothetical protein
MTDVATPRTFGFLLEAPGEHDTCCGGPNRDASVDLLTGAIVIPDVHTALVTALPLFKDQGFTSTCVPTALLNIGETSLRAISGKPVEPSSIPAAYAASNALLRTRPGEPIQDIGTYGRTVNQILKDWGAARDVDYPLRDPTTGEIHMVDDPEVGRTSVVTANVPPHVLQHASSWKLDEQLTIYARGPARIETIAAAIVTLAGIGAAGVVDTAFMNYDGHGVLGPPKPGDVRGRHMVAIIAFRRNPTTRKREFLIRNSWSLWGLTFMDQPSLAWVSEDWVQAQDELYQLRVSRGRKTV